MADSGKIVGNYITLKKGLTKVIKLNVKDLCFMETNFHIKPSKIPISSKLPAAVVMLYTE